MESDKKIVPYNGNFEDFVRRVIDAMAQEGIRVTPETVQKIKDIAEGKTSADEIIKRKVR